MSKLRKCVLLLSAVVVGAWASMAADLRISEICPRPRDANGFVVKDPNGYASGWIELYNPGPDAVNLKDYALERFNRGKAVKPGAYANLPDRTLAAKAYAVVYTSDAYPADVNDGVTPFVSGGETVVPFKVNPKKFPMIRLTKGGVELERFLVPVDLPDGQSFAPAGGDFATCPAQPAASGAATSIKTPVAVTRVILPTPTKGAANNYTGAVAYGPNAGPLYGVKHTLSDLDSVPQAKAGADYPVSLMLNPLSSAANDQIASATLYYRADYGEVRSVPLAYATTDETAGATYTATIPASGVPAAGHLLRWCAVVTDKAGNSWRTPSFRNPDNGYEWYGTLVEPTADQISATLQTWHIFTDELTETDMEFNDGNDDLYFGYEWTDRDGTAKKGWAGYLAVYHPYGMRVALYDSQTSNYYDNVEIAVRGNTTGGYPKKSHTLRFNKCKPMVCVNPFDGEQIECRKTSVIAEYVDSSRVIACLSLKIRRDAGQDVPFCYPVRVQRNGAFYQLDFHTNRFTDELFDDYYGYDMSGYAVKNIGNLGGTTTAGWSYKPGLNPKYPDNKAVGNQILPDPDDGPHNIMTKDGEVLAFQNSFSAEVKNNHPTLAGMTAEQQATVNRAVVNSFDLPAWLNFLALSRLTQEGDDVWANLCLYCDVNGTGTWRPMAYDVDSCMNSAGNNDAGMSHPFYGGLRVSYRDNDIRFGNHGFEAIYQNPKFRRLMLRRLRTLMDAYLKEPGTSQAETPFWRDYIPALANAMRADSVLDNKKWSRSDMDASITRLWTNFITQRRTHLFETHSVDNTALSGDGYGRGYNACIPHAQSPIENLKAGLSVAYDEAHGAVVIRNANDETIDLSGWTLKGRIKMTLPVGTVIDQKVGSTDGEVYVTADRRATVAAFGSALVDQVIVGNGEADVTSLKVSLLTADGEPVCLDEPDENAFVPGGNGNWNVAANWALGTVPGGAGAACAIGVPTAADRTVTVNTPVTIGKIDFLNGDKINRLAVTGGDLTLDGTIAGVVDDAHLTVDDTNTVGLATVTVAAGKAIRLVTDLEVKVKNTVGDPKLGGLVIEGALAGNGHNLKKTGEGRLTLRLTNAAGETAPIAKLQADNGILAIETPFTVTAVTKGGPVWLSVSATSLATAATGALVCTDKLSADRAGLFVPATKGTFYGGVVASSVKNTDGQTVYVPDANGDVSFKGGRWSVCEEATVTIVDTTDGRKTYCVAVSSEEEEVPEVTPEAGNLKLYPLFSNNMILQRDRNVKIWGTADPSASVSVWFAGAKATGTADATGAWSVTFAKKFSASTTGQTLTVSDGTHVIACTNVLVGDVWLALGQSNMELTLRETTMDKDYTPEATDLIRFRRLEKVLNATATSFPEDKSGGVGHDWCASSVNFLAHSAVGFHFARFLRKAQPGVPQGILDSSYGGTSLAYHLAPNGRVWGGMTRWLVGYEVRGAIWYQGCSDYGNKGRIDYAAQLEAMVTDYRAKWGRTASEFPFYIVQIAIANDDAYYTQKVGDQGGSSWIRDCHRKVSESLASSGLAVSFDVCETPIHPRHKSVVGERLAKLARKNVYGENLVAEGPMFASAARESGKIRVSFRSDTLSGGLVTGQSKKADENYFQLLPGVAPLGFQVADADGNWAAATAEIAADGKSVLVWSSDIADPRQVSYAHCEVPMAQNGGQWFNATLYNSEGLPASPFGPQEATDGPVPPQPTHTHNYGAWTVTKAATCTAAGVETRTCTATGCTTPPASETRTVAALGHQWGAWVVTREPQVGVKGEETRVCTRTGCGATETRDIDPLPGPEPDPQPGEIVQTDYGYRIDLTVGTAIERICVYTNTVPGYTFTVPADVTSLRYLVVGGGGAGGLGYAAVGGGGGGGGGVLTDSVTVTPGQVFAIAVGAGGAGRNEPPSATTAAAGAKGSDSTLVCAAASVNAVAQGGGGGGSFSGARAATAGGCGGGGGTSNIVGGKGVSGQGYDGGKGSYSGSAGGGGAGGPGGNADTTTNNGGNGGMGLASDITGVTRYYGAGGAGGKGNGATADGQAAVDGAGMGENGTDGLGAGGGGATVGGSVTGGGGSGAVILRYALSGEPPEPPEHTHTWGDWVVTTEPQVGVKGEEMRTCAGCTATETRDIDPLPEPLPEGTAVVPYFGKGRGTACRADGNHKYEAELASGRVSLGCWVKLRYTANGGDYDGIVSMCGRNTSNGPMTLYCNHYTTAANRGLGVFVTGTTGGYAEVIAKGDYNDAKWHYVMGTYDAPTGDLKLYVDGQLAGSTTKANAALKCGQVLRIGTDTQNTARIFDGSVTRVSLWNTVVSEADAKAMYTARTDLVGNESGLVGYWPCEDETEAGTGVTGTLVDKTANGHDLAYGTTKVTSNLTLDWIADDNYPFGGEPEPAEKPTVDGETVEPTKVFDVASSAKPITYPSAPTLAGVIGAQTIAFGGTTVNVPEYYTATLGGNTVSLVLNANAIPTIADGRDGTKAFVVTETTLTIHLEHTYGALSYALATAERLDGSWTTGAFEKGRTDFTCPRDAKARACFCRIVVAD